MNRSFRSGIAFFVYGNFAADDLQQPMVDSNPGPWCSTVAHLEPEAALAQKWPLTEPPFCDLLVEEDEATVRRAVESTGVVSVVAESECSEDPLGDYLAVAQLVSLLAATNGAEAVVDLKTGMIFSADAWTTQVGIPLATNDFNIADHIQQSVIGPDGGAYWLSTRGMGKFAKPELSIHGLTADGLGAAGALLNSLALSMIVNNEWPEDGDTVVQVPKITEYQARHAGSYEDEEFWNNVHIELSRSV